MPPASPPFAPIPFQEIIRIPRWPGNQPGHLADKELARLLRCRRPAVKPKSRRIPHFITLKKRAARLAADGPLDFRVLSK
jgi:hypothetical protein